MPISADRFEELSTDSDDGPTPGTNADEILTYLRKNPEQAFTQSEIATATDVKAGSVGPTLVRLRERGRVDHRGNYWRVSDHESSLDAAASHTAEVAASHEPDGEGPSHERWQEHAVNPNEIDRDE